MLRGLSGVLALLLGCNAAHATEDAVLLGSTTPGYGQGMTVSLEDRLRLPEGASLTLLLRSGQVLRLRGPLDTSLERSMGDARAANSAAALAEALRLRGIDASAIGGTRTAAAPSTMQPRPQEVAVEIGRSGTYCIRATDMVWLVQPRAERPTIILRRGGNRRSLAWPKGAMRIEWPGDLSIADGDRFEVLVEDQPAAVITFRMPAENPASETGALAEAMLLGCREQHAAALRRLAASLLSPEAFLVSERGTTPHYRPGEMVRLGVLTTTDGWLYCVAQRDDGSAWAIFPHRPGDSARWPAGPQSALREISFPAGPTGEERVRCWLTERDIGRELPSALTAGHGDQLPERLTALLDETFASLAGNRLGTARLTISIGAQ